jgi:hypothetical protein
VGIKTWGEIIEENRARLQFFQEQMQHQADESAAIRYLQERHSKFLEGVVEESTSGDEEDGNGEDAKTPRAEEGQGKARRSILKR